MKKQTIATVLTFTLLSISILQTTVNSVQAATTATSTATLTIVDNRTDAEKKADAKKEKEKKAHEHKETLTLIDNGGLSETIDNDTGEVTYHKDEPSSETKSQAEVTHYDSDANNNKSKQESVKKANNNKSHHEQKSVIEQATDAVSHAKDIVLSFIFSK